MTTMYSTLGRAATAAGLAGLGVLGLVYGDFAINWQPVPATLPGHAVLAYAAAVLSLAVAASLWSPRTAAAGACVLLVYLGVGGVLPQLVKASATPALLAAWLGVCEPLFAAAAAWILWRMHATQAVGERSLRLARAVLGLACLVFGASHLVYGDFTAMMIPAWLPARLALAWITGLAHIAAGVALVTGVQARLAAVLEALMMSGFVALVHVPSLFAAPAWAPTPRLQWTALLWATLLAGSAWTAAASFAPRRR